jgi:hypothetical protein
MRIKTGLSLAGLALLLAPLSAQALTNNSNYLVLAPGDTLQAYGVIYRNVSIVVSPGARIELPQNSNDPAKWSLQLIAPAVYIGGTLCADGAGFNTLGLGIDSGGTTIGAGGSGYGGKGGNGNYHYNSGGNTYGFSSTFEEAAGTKQTGGSYGGGGRIRVDAMILTLTASSILTASGSASRSGGGGSGGCIFLNGIDTYLYGNLYANGGDGQLDRIVLIRIGLNWIPVYYPGGGGGGGGRIKVLYYPGWHIGLNSAVAGGAGGGGTSTSGASGQFNYYYSPTVDVPTLLAPDNGQEVGLRPTFNFMSSDQPNSPFLQYQIQVSTDPGFASLVISEMQMSTGPISPGWNGKIAFQSNQMGSFTTPAGNPLSASQTYYWRMKVTNCKWKNSTGYSSVRSFSTIDNMPPLPPLMVNPANGQTNVSKLPALQVLGADPNGNSVTFSVVLSQDPNLMNPQIIQTNYPGWAWSNTPSAYRYAGVTNTCQIQNSPSYPDTLVPGATYYWQTTVYDQLQEAAVAEDIYSFTVVPLPAMPLLAAPVNQTIVTTRMPFLQMVSSSPTGSSLRYKVEIGPEDFQTITTYLSSSGLGWTQSQYASDTIARLQIPASNALVSGTTYSWQVTAYDVDNDNWSITSGVQTFTVITPPLVPQLLSPPDHFAAPDPGLIFSFQATSESGNTLTYRFELSSDNFAYQRQTFYQNAGEGTWGSPEYASDSPAAFSLPASATLLRGQAYQWRVQAWDGFSWGPYSEIRNFSLANSLEIAASKVYPNPAVSARQLHIQLEPSVTADVTVRVFNAQAKEIKRLPWSVLGGQNNDFTLDISGFAPGPYFLILEIQSPYGAKKITKRFAVVN